MLRAARQFTEQHQRRVAQRVFVTDPHREYSLR